MNNDVTDLATKTTDLNTEKSEGRDPAYPVLGNLAVLEIDEIKIFKGKELFGESSGFTVSQASEQCWSADLSPFDQYGGAVNSLLHSSKLLTIIQDEKSEDQGYGNKVCKPRAQDYYGTSGLNLAETACITSEADEDGPGNFQKKKTFLHCKVGFP